MKANSYFPAASSSPHPISYDTHRSSPRVSDHHGLYLALLFLCGGPFCALLLLCRVTDKEATPICTVHHVFIVCTVDCATDESGRGLALQRTDAAFQLQPLRTTGINFGTEFSSDYRCVQTVGRCLYVSHSGLTGEKYIFPRYEMRSNTFTTVRRLSSRHAVVRTHSQARGYTYISGILLSWMNRSGLGAVRSNSSLFLW